jgi:hypothetical protein
MFLTDGRLYKTKTTIVKPVKVIGFEEELAGTYNSATAYRFIWVQDNKLKYKIRVNYALSEKLSNGDTVQLVEVVSHYKLFNFDRIKHTVAEEVEYCE